MKVVIIMVMLAALVATATATPILTPTKEAVLYANCIKDGAFITSAANITIYYPNATLWVNQSPMMNYTQTGNFRYNLTTPTITGDYEYLVSCYKDSDTAQNGGTFQVKNLEDDIGMSQVAIVLLFAGIGAILIYLGHITSKRPSFYKIMSVALYMLAVWMIPVGLGVLTYGYMVNTSMYPLMNTLFIASIILSSMILVVWLILTAIDMIAGTLGSVGGMMNNGKR